jgi:hypothetical protein
MSGWDQEGDISDLMSQLQEPDRLDAACREEQRQVRSGWRKKRNEVNQWEPGPTPDDFQ